MNKFTSYSKSSKKKRKQMDRQKRITWGISPVTRMPMNPKAYRRNKEKMEYQRRNHDDF